MTLRTALQIALLALAFALATTTLGWWTVPVLGGVWGVVAAPWERPGRVAALAAGLAWAVLLVWGMLTAPSLLLAGKVGGVMGVPGAVLIAATVALPVVLAGTAAYFIAMVKGLMFLEAPCHNQTLS